MVMKIGVIGASPGNGHPFSFSALVNGYDSSLVRKAGWSIIADYLDRRDQSEFGIAGVQVTHAWTQNYALTRALCTACHITHPVLRCRQMATQVDAVIIARDDYRSHLPLALPFLKRGLPVFIDKPLALKQEELRVFSKYLERGQLMSCSAARYATELDQLRLEPDGLGEITLVRGLTAGGWEKYGIHLLEAITAVCKAQPLSVQATEWGSQCFMVRTAGGCTWQINTSVRCPPELHLHFSGTQRCLSVNLADNFTMFKRMLWHFVQLVKKGFPPVHYLETLGLMRLLMAGRLSRVRQREVLLSEVELQASI